MHVFPLIPGSKKPLTENGFKDATNNPASIAAWGQRWPNANLGCATGQKSGIVVLDIDPKPIAQDILQEFERRFQSLPPTATAISGGGGYHLYFKSKTALPCRTKIIPGVDFRGDGGYIVLPPSVHKNGQRYYWHPQRHIDTQPIVDIPSWLVDVILDCNLTSPPSTSFKNFTAAGIEEGSRAVSLASIIGHLLVKRVDPNLTKELVLALNQNRFRPPLPENEVLSILNSIAGRELKKRMKGGSK
jgi:hypothetical protein